MKVYSKNISGLTGALLIISLIIIGFIAFTVIIIAIAVIAGLFLIFLLIRKISLSLGIMKKPKEPVVTYSWEDDVKEIPEKTEGEKK